MSSERVFTPRMKLEGGGETRLTLHLNDEDYGKLGRGRGWSATVRNLDDGKVYKVRAASCGIPNCFCDAIAKEADHD